MALAISLHIQGPIEPLNNKLYTKGKRLEHSECGRVEEAGSRGAQREKEDLDRLIFCLSLRNCTLEAHAKMPPHYHPQMHESRLRKNLLFLPEVMDLKKKKIKNKCVYMHIKKLP